MGLVTERTTGGLRLRVVVSDEIWSRIQKTSEGLAVDEQRVLQMAVAIGVRYLSFIANPMTPELLEAQEAALEREGDELKGEIETIRG